jgi:hypothetical protein
VTSRVMFLALLAVLLVECAPHRTLEPDQSEVLFSGSLQELAPHHPGDHWVYRATGGGQDERLQVEHLSALPSPGEFTLDLREDGQAIGKAHLRETSNAMLLVSEGLLQQDLMLVYAEPLPTLCVPLRSRQPTVRSPVTLLRLSDGEVLAQGRAELTVTARRSDSANGERLEIRTERRVVMPGQAMHLDVTTWVTPGIGETRSRGFVDGGPSIERELVCSIIDGKRVGDCTALLAPRKAE